MLTDVIGARHRSEIAAVPHRTEAAVVTANRVVLLIVILVVDDEVVAAKGGAMVLPPEENVFILGAHDDVLDVENILTTRVPP